MKKTLKNKKGSALLIAIVIMVVLMMLGLALLLVSYSLFATANKQQNVEQCKEIAQGISKEIENEITSVSFESYEKQETSFLTGENQLWFYLRYNIWQTNWPYYNADEPYGHSTQYAYRYFDITAGTNVDTSLVDDTAVMMYWESENGADPTAKNDTPLTVQVTCTKGKQKATITTHYTLSVDSDKPYDNTGSSEPDEVLNSGQMKVVNPTGNRQSDPSEAWHWTFNERE